MQGHVSSEKCLYDDLTSNGEAIRVLVDDGNLANHPFLAVAGGSGNHVDT
jgi:hypothetical protein